MDNTETMKQVYLLAQDHCGLKVGDWVKVVRTAKDFEAGWNSYWNQKKMNNTVGNIYEIDDIALYGILLNVDKTTYYYPYFILEKVEKSPHKFKSYEQVLVRNKDNERWRPDIFLYIPEICHELFVCSRGAWQQCIPYKGNEHLAGTMKKPEE